MSDNFNFGNLSSVKPASTVSYLKPYGVYKDVTIKSSEVKEGTSNKTGKPWKSLNITFGNDEGIFSHSIFYFNEKDPKNWERNTVNMANGGKREMPSTAEELQNTIAAIGFAFFPEDFKKLQQVASKVKTTDELMTYFKKFVDKNIDKNPTYMKLVGRNSDGRVYASFPKFTGIAQATEKTAAANGVEVGSWYTWMSSPFNSDPTRLAFNNWEQQQADDYHKAKPTPMKSTPETSTTETDDDIDFDAMLAGL